MTTKKKAWSLKLHGLDQHSSKIHQSIMVGNKLVGSLAYEYGYFSVWYRYSQETPPFRETPYSTYDEAIRAIDKHINET